MRRKREEAEGSGMAFLDTISCGFGAMILLLLISKTGLEEPEAGEADLGGSTAKIIAEVLAETSALTSQIFDAEQAVESLADTLQQLTLTAVGQEANTAQQQAVAAAQAEELQKLKAEREQLQADSRGLELVKKTLQRASVQRATTDKRDIEVGGIPVDSEYVVFLLDTSGSMKQIWHRVVAEMENVLDVHPTVKGFQIINDNGGHLLKGYKGRWIPDTPGRRKSVVNALRGWNAASNSSPVEGLKSALRLYGNRGDGVSIYIFGDDYTGPGYDVVIRTLDRWRAQHRKAKVRVHAIGLYSGNSNLARFLTLMRATTHRNDGTLLLLPLEDAHRQNVTRGCSNADLHPHGGRCRSAHSYTGGG